jgi:serine/threonine-protein phosphatase PP1-1
MVDQDKVPQPGPAKLTKNADLDEWLDAAKRNKFLPERVMKQLFEMCKELLMEESNTQPVSTPVTICGDIHGQFYDLLELLRVAGGMPGEDNVETSSTVNRAFSPEDIEPPTEITDPKLKKKLRNSPLASVAEGETTTVNNDPDDDDDEEEHRGRSRSIGTHPDAIKEGGQGLPGNQNFIFMGDFVDRGYFSLETLSLLLCLKARYVKSQLFTSLRS